MKDYILNSNGKILVNSDRILKQDGETLAFQINGSTSFDPSITSSEVGIWDFGDGTTYNGNTPPAKVYPNTNVYNVSFRFRNLSKVIAIKCDTDDIVGILDVSKLTKCTSFEFPVNANLTKIVFPYSTAVVSNIRVYSCKITGILDLSKLVNLSGQVHFYSNSLLTSVINPISSQIISQYYAFSCNLTGILDLSGLTGLSGNFQAYSNPNLTQIINPINNNTFTLYQVNTCGLIGTLDISGLSGLGGSFYAQSNTNLTLILNPSTNNTFITYYAYLCNLDYVDFIVMPNMTNVNNSHIRLENNNMSAADVNHILVDLNNISIAGYTGRIINIGGTNADPDSTSGGYDGVVARNSLISKGFTVTIT